MAHVRRPPLVLVFLAVLMVALGQTAGAVMSQAGPETARYARARIAANAPAHGLAGSREYDDEVIARAVFTTEAGLSFLHTHAEGLGPVILVAATLVATAVPRRRARGALYALLGAAALFPLGFLVYALAVPEMGRDAGIALAERFVLIPLGSAALLALLGLAVFLRRPTP
jgi:hypothetical protein